MVGLYSQPWHCRTVYCSNYSAGDNFCWIHAVLPMKLHGQWPMTNGLICDCMIQSATLSCFKYMSATKYKTPIQTLPYFQYMVHLFLSPLEHSLLLKKVQDMVWYFELLTIYRMLLCPTFKIWSFTMNNLQDTNPFFPILIIWLSVFGYLSDTVS